MLAVLIALFVLLPLVWMLSTAFKNDFEALSGRMNFFPQKPTLDNFAQGLGGELMNTPILRWIINSLSVGIAGTAIVLLIDSMAAFALARLPDLPLRRTLLSMFIASLMIPGVLTFLPMYMEFNALGLINTYQALILPATAGAFRCSCCTSSLSIFPKRLKRLPGSTE